MKAILTVGVSASGKTTWAEQFVKENQGWININRDDIRFALLGVRDWSKWNWKREKEVNEEQSEMIARAVNLGLNIIISDTNLNTKHRITMTQRLEALGYQVELKLFEVSYEDAVKRDALRANGVGSSVIAKQFEQYQEFLWENGAYSHEYNNSLPWCVIFDIDGTLAHMNGRGPFDWHLVGNDDLDLATANIICRFEGDVTKIFIFSGRDSICRAKTEDWLDHHFIPFDELVMRPEGDMRKDTIVKEEMFNEHIRDKYNVLFVMDDRPSVCRMWRSMGLKVLQVGNPHVEF